MRPVFSLPSLFLLLLLTGSSLTAGPGSPGNDHARDLFKRLGTVYGVDRISADRFPVLAVEGISYIYGHYPSPWDSIPLRHNGLLWCEQGITRMRENVTTRRDHTFEVRTLVSDTLVFRHDDDYDSPDKLTSSDIDVQRFRLSRLSPALLLMSLKEKEASFDLLREGDSVRVLACDNFNGGSLHIVLNGTGDRISHIEHRSRGDYRGDKVTMVRYSEERSEEGILYPSVIAVFEYGHYQSEWTVRCADAGQVDSARFALPEGYAMVPDTTGSAKPEPDMVWQNIAENLYAIDIRHLNNRTLVAEFADYCVVMEAGQNSETGELITDMVERRLPGKPVRYFAFGHHHPDFIGGVRAFAAVGSTIITPAGTEMYVRDLLSRSHRFNPDRWEEARGADRQPSLLSVEDSCVFADSENELRVYNIGKASTHTRDYFLFYFPGQKILFEGDMGLMREGRTSKLWAGEKGVIAFVREKALDVERVLQSWPLQRNGAITDFPFSLWEQMLESETAEQSGS